MSGRLFGFAAFVGILAWLTGVAIDHAQRALDRLDDDLDTDDDVRESMRRWPP